ncbi:lipase member H [Aethina tumida]|uniref:lipase member H n=1 Tax=Aethina tumida TaxID=116153 RepID=UPI00096AE063|nr:lipase member H [Aethina tumida]
MGVVNVVTTALCLLSNLNQEPPSLTFQRSFFTLYNIDRVLCPPVRKNEVNFYLYTRKTTSTPEQLFLNDPSTLSKSHFSTSKPTVFFIHGFLESSASHDATAMKKAQLERADCNMILVDAKLLFAGPNYFTGAANVEAVGKYIAEFIDFLVSQGVNLSDVEVTGMSLGGQTTGIVGQNVKSGKLPKILAFDPAGPLFNFYPDHKRLDKSDAELVIVIHSNSLLNGYYESCGHVDFWINGKPFLQPGCDPVDVNLRTSFDIPELIFCSHFLSYRVGAYSIMNPQSFPSRKCDSYNNYKSGQCNNNDLQYVGDNVTSSASGDYYITLGDDVYSKFSAVGIQ